MTMQTKRKFTARKWLAAMLCLTIALMTTHLTAWAVDLNQANLLTVTSNENMSGAEITVDVYKLADTVEVPGFDTYGYNFTEAYGGIVIDGVKLEENIGLSKGTYSLSNDKWNEIAQEACKLIQKEDIEPTKYDVFGSQFSLGSGVYLIIAHGSKMEDYWGKTNVENNNVENGAEDSGDIVTYAQSDYNKFTFTPAIVSLPTKGAIIDDAGNETIGTAVEYGDWLYTSSIYMKAEIEPLYGTITIEKRIDEYSGSDVETFVFQIDATGNFPDDPNYRYSNDVEIVFNASTAETSTATVGPIRAGAQITSVTEVYTGLHYTLGSVIYPGGNPNPIIPADGSSDEPITFTFINTLDNDHPSDGGSVGNHFVNEDGEWKNNPQKINN